MSMRFHPTDGGRAAAGFKGTTGDCVTRAVAIATGQPYAVVYAALAAGMGQQRRTKRSPKRSSATARDGITVRRKWFRDYMAGLGWEWVPTMQIGQGCRVHLDAKELPPGRVIVALSKHYTAVIDGTIHDAYDPQWWTSTPQPDGTLRHAARCVYGYWRKA